MPTNLKKLQQQLKKLKIAAFIVPSNDEFQSEFTPAYAQRLTWLTGFTGSAGTAVVLCNKAAFFTDGRYTLQAKTQVSDDFEKYNIADKKPWQWLKENIKKENVIGVDPWLHTKSNIKHYLEITDKILPVLNPIDLIWEDRPLQKPSVAKIHMLKYAGEKPDSKIKKITAILKEKEADACILTSPDSICWLLNIRGNDIPNSPILLCYAIIYAKGNIELIIDKDCIDKKVKAHLGSKVKITLPENLKQSIKYLDNKPILLDPATSPVWFFNNLKKSVIIEGDDPCLLLKACKNNVEIAGTIEAHIIDGAAVTKFLCWINENHAKEKITETSIDKKLIEFRSQSELFQQTSFDTIAGFKENGAIVHYRASEKTSKTVSGNGVMLVDSGGQYLNGTTDITRTFAIGEPTKEQMRNFTLVLKGHIALATAIFPEGTTGSQLDILARKHLWDNGLDYDHGTGHGVGSYLNVHEGPHRISKMPNTIALKVGMIVSNEPGYYKSGEYGIRIENLVLVRQYSKGFLCFETITKAPIDKKLIDESIMTDSEKKWLDAYHKQVKKELSPLLDGKTKKWLGSSI